VNALQNYSRLDASFFATLLVKHSSGLSVLAAPSEMAPTQVSDEAINRLVAVARQEFDYVVVDAGSRLNIQSTDLFDRSATVYLVTQVGIPELRNSNRMITQLNSRLSSTGLRLAPRELTKNISRRLSPGRRRGRFPTIIPLCGGCKTLPPR